MLALAPDQASRLRDYCASSVFVKVLLLKGYSFDEKSFSRISFKKKVKALASLNSRCSYENEVACSNHMYFISSCRLAMPQLGGLWATC